MTITFRPAPAHCAADYVRLRGLTRENAVPEERLRTLGITAESWSQDIRSKTLQGTMVLSDQQPVAYCFGNSNSGEVVVLAVLPSFEGQGIGRRLLAMVVGLLHRQGHSRLFLGCAADPTVRSHGFYRHLGWRSTRTFDERGDELLERIRQPPCYALRNSPWGAARRCSCQSRVVRPTGWRIELV